jgi:hypothetical protein
MTGPFPIRPRLLLVGNDITLLYSREMLLGTRFAIQISGRNSEALKLLRDLRFDLVVILEPDDTWRRFSSYVVQQIPPPKILAVVSPETESSQWTEAALCRSKGLYDLMKCCMELFGMVTKAKSRGYSNRDYKKAVGSA